MNQYHRLTNLYFQDNWLVLTIDGEEKKYAIQEISPALTKASEEERNNFEISPSGLGLCRLNENAPVLRPSVRNCIRKFPKPLLEQGNLIQEALSLYQKNNLDFADALMASTALRKGPPSIFSFDLHAEVFFFREAADCFFFAGLSPAMKK